MVLGPRLQKKEPVKKVEPPLEGWLMKKSDKGVVKRWYWRWFAYDAPSHKLLYYTKEGPKMEMKGYGTHIAMYVDSAHPLMLCGPGQSI